MIHNLFKRSPDTAPTQEENPHKRAKALVAELGALFKQEKIEGVMLVILDNGEYCSVTRLCNAKGQVFHEFGHTMNQFPPEARAHIAEGLICDKINPDGHKNRGVKIS